MEVSIRSCQMLNAIFTIRGSSISNFFLLRPRPIFFFFLMAARVYVAIIYDFSGPRAREGYERRPCLHAFGGGGQKNFRAKRDRNSRRAPRKVAPKKGGQKLADGAVFSAAEICRPRVPKVEVLVRQSVYKLKFLQIFFNFTPKFNYDNFVRFLENGPKFFRNFFINY